MLFVCGALPLRVAVVIKVIGCCLIDVGCLPVCDCLVWLRCGGVVNSVVYGRI